MENWLPLFYNNSLTTIFEYIPDNSILFFKSELMNLLDSDYSDIAKHHSLRKDSSEYKPVCIENFYINILLLKDIMNKYVNIVASENNAPADSRKIDLNFKNVPNFFEEHSKKNSSSRVVEYISRMLS
ncbi:MAG: hypothetical protein GX638_13200 [Crenarchaeota archaeon]|nr:hypothetical protein [Thermoproteota archaeon]